MIFDFADYMWNRSTQQCFSANDACRMAAYFIQDGKCYVTGMPLQPGQRQLHHRKPRCFGGEDVPENLILLNRTVHSMIHAAAPEAFDKLLAQFPLSGPELALVNQLRYEAHCAPCFPNRS